MKTAKTALKVIAFILLELAVYAAAANAQQIPNIQGRWEFVTVTGDSPTQLNDMGQSTISTYLLQSGNTITNNVPMTSDTFADDEYDYNNSVFTGSITKQGNITLKYTHTNPDGTSFTYNYSGQLRDADGDNPLRITGTYTTTSWTSSGSGNFVATFFPDFTNINYTGALEGPDMPGSTGPSNVAMSFTLNTNPDHSVTLTNINIGQPLAACFVPPITSTNDPNFPLVPTSAAGVAASFYLIDSVGNRMFMSGYFTEPDGLTPAALDEIYFPGEQTSSTVYAGTNKMMVAVYSIDSNNSCNGYGGGDTPFQPVPDKHQKHEHKKHHGNHND